MDVSGASCKSNEYWGGFKCLEKKYDPIWCPLSTDNPTSSGKATCETGGATFWYIQVGGKLVNYQPGKDAMCLDHSFKVVYHKQDPSRSG